MKVEGILDTQSILPLKPVTREDAGTAERKSPQVLKGENETAEEKNEDMSVDKAVDLLNKTMQSYNTELQFTLHKDSGEYIVKVINATDHTVIREIPPERVLDMVAHFKKMLGLIVDKFI